MSKYGHVNLAWATRTSEYPFINFGDELSYYINRKIIESSIPIKHSNFNCWDDRICSIGTILNEFHNGRVYVWGSGFDIHNIHPRFMNTRLHIYATRGTYSAQYLQSLGKSYPIALGDPGILLNRYMVKNIEPQYELGIIPHCSNCIIEQNKIVGYATSCYREYDDSVKLISPKTIDNVENVLDVIVNCKRILSESIHGCIVADSLGIPNLFLQGMPVTKSLVRDTKYPQIEHRYQDYISIFPEKKFVFHHNKNDEFDIDMTIKQIDQHYVPVNLYEIGNRLLEAHPLLIND